MVKKAILFFTVLFMIFGCEPTVYEGAEKVENPTKSRSGFFNTDVTLGNDVVSVFNQYGESVSGFVLSEEGEYTITYTDGKTEEIVIDKTPPVINGFANTEQMLNLTTEKEIADNLGENAVSDNLSGWDYEMTATWKDGRDPFKEGPGDYVRVYVVYDRAGNASEPFEWEITAYKFDGAAGEEVTLVLKEGGQALDGNRVEWYKERNDVTLTADVTGGTGPDTYTYVWTVDGEVQETDTNKLMLNITEEKVYTVTLKVKDEGGMPAIETVAIGFDQTAPVIQRGVKTLTGYTDAERLEFKESTSDLRIIESGSGVDTINGQYVDAVEEIELFVPYQRTVTVTDKAGNVSEEFIYEIMFEGTAQEEDEAKMDGAVATPVPTDGFPLPSDSQVKWMQMEQYAFIHWGPNTFGAGEIGDGEWGNGYPAGADAFRPGSDADTITQGWIDDVVTAGMTGIIMVAKHHDGFCLWDTVTTEYSVCKSGDGYSYHNEDYLKALIENMRDYNRAHPEAPLKLGVYVSPWDRNNWTYAGVDENGEFPYLEYVFRTQVTEVVHYVEEYGEGDVILFELWLDGANTPSGWYGGQLYDAHVREGSSVTVPILDNGRADFTKFEQNYNYSGKLNSNLTHRSVTLPSDWRARIYSVAQEVVDSYKPTADHEVMIFGSQIRWVGNEQGWAGRTNWIMPPLTSANLDNTVGGENATTVKPAEADMKTQNGWFYTANEDKGAAKMIEFWYRSVGRNGTLLLNFSPDTSGVIPSYNLESAQTMWKTVSSDLDDNLTARAYKVSASHVRDNHIDYSPYKVIDGDYETYWTVGDGRGSDDGNEWIQVTFSEALSFNRIVLQENIRFGQRVKEFTVEYKNGEDDTWKKVTYPNMPTTISGDSNDPDDTTTIGYKRILRSNTVSATDVRVTFTNYRKDTRVPVVLSEFGLYLAD